MPDYAAYPYQPPRTVGAMPPNFNAEDTAWHEVLRNREMQDRIEQEYRDIAPFYFNQAENYRRQADQSWQDLGYTPEEIAQLRGYAQNVQGLQLTPQELQQLYMTPEEQGAVAGNPFAARDWLNPQKLEGIAAQGAKGQYEAIGEASKNVLGNINPDWYAVDPAFRAAQEGTISGLTGGEFLDPSRLRLSEGFQENYPMTDEEVSGHGELAGRAASARYQAEMDEIARRAGASGGTSSLAMAAYADRMGREGRIGAADAAAAARLGALGLQRDQMAQAEGMRLGAEQGLTDRYQRGATTALGARADIEGMRLQGGARYGDTLQRGGMYLGDLQTGVARDVANRGIGTQQYITDVGSDLTRYGDEARSDRAAYLSGQRRGAAQYGADQRYGRGMDIAGFGYGVDQDIAGQRLGDQQAYRGYLAGQQGYMGDRFGQQQDERYRNRALYGGLTSDALANRNNLKRSGLRNQILGGIFNTAMSSAVPKIPGFGD